MKFISILREVIGNLTASLEQATFIYRQTHVREFVEGLLIAASWIAVALGIGNALCAYNESEQIRSFGWSLAGQFSIGAIYWQRSRRSRRSRLAWYEANNLFTNCRNCICNHIEDPNWAAGDEWLVGEEKENLSRRLDRAMGRYEVWLAVYAEFLPPSDQDTYSKLIRDRGREAERLKEEMWPSR